MGLINKNEQKGKGIHYVEGAPNTIKSDSKAGQFKLLGEKFGAEQMTVHFLKDVSLGRELILYPFQDNMKKNKFRQVFFIDCETDEVCATLLKSYNEGGFNRLKAEIKHYNKVEKQACDISDFEITMTFKDISEITDNGMYAIDFTFCKDNDGDPCRYVVGTQKGIEVNKKANVQELTDELFARNLDFYNKFEQGDGIYDARLMDEVFKHNFDKTQVPEAQHTAAKMALLAELGIVSINKAKSLATRVIGGLSLSSELKEEILQLA